MKILFRKSFIIILTVILYFLSFYYLFVNISWINAIVNIIFLFLILHYFFIEIKEYDKKIFLIVLFILSFFELNFFISDLYVVLGIILFNLSIFGIYYDIYENLVNKVYFDSFSIFIGGISKFAIIISLVFTLLIMDKYKTFDVKCDTLYNGLYSLIDTVSKPLKISVNEVNILKEKIDDFYTLKVKDILGITNYTGTILTGNLSNIISSGFNTTGYMIDSVYIENKGLIGKLQELKVSLIDKVIKDKKSVDKGICEYMVEKIKYYYDKPGIRLTALILIVFLLQPFLRIGLYIISIVNWILFNILRLFKIYKIEKVFIEKETII